MDVHSSIQEAVRKILEIARFTLQEHKLHMPTAVIHSFDGMVPIILPFKDDEQKRALVEYVKDEAVKIHAYAVTAVTSARIVDSRTGAEEECLVLATAIQGGRPYVLVQHFTRDDDRGIVDFGAVVEGEDAEMPGQMIIMPEWDREVSH